MKPITAEQLRAYYERLGMDFEILDDYGAARAAAITATGDEDQFYGPKKSRKAPKARSKAKERDDDVSVQENEDEQ